MPRNTKWHKPPEDAKLVDYDSYEELYEDVRPRKGGPYSLFCYTCRRWIPNTANSEMLKEGVFAHSHRCVKENGKVRVIRERGIPEEDEEG